MKKISELDLCQVAQICYHFSPQAKSCILAIAPTLHQRIQFEPPLPPMRSQLIQRVPMGNCIKNNVFYDKPFWRKKGRKSNLAYKLYGYPVAISMVDLLVFFLLGMNGFTSCDGTEAVSNTVDDCKPDGTVPAITG